MYVVRQPRPAAVACPRHRRSRVGCSIGGLQNPSTGPASFNTAQPSERSVWKSPEVMGAQTSHGPLQHGAEHDAHGSRLGCRHIPVDSSRATGRDNQGSQRGCEQVARRIGPQRSVGQAFEGRTSTDKWALLRPSEPCSTSSRCFQ